MLNKVTIKQIRAFVAVAKNGSFADASEGLHVTQPALSMSIKNLEEAVGGALFLRTTRELVLTPEGRIFLPIAKQMLLDLENSMDELGQLFTLNEGLLRVAVMPSFATTNLSKVVSQYKSTYPNIKLKIMDVVAEEAIELVKQNRAELAITFEPEDLEDSEFVPLFKDEFIAAVPANHTLATQATLSWEQLVTYPVIALNKPSSIRHLMEAKLADRDLALQVEIEANQLLTIINLVEANMGVSVVPGIFADYSKDRNVRFVPLHNPSISRKIGIVYNKRQALSSAATEFIELLRRIYPGD